MNRIPKGFRNNEWTPDPFIGLDKFPKDIIIALLEQREMQDQIAFIGTLIIILGEIKLIIAGVDVVLYRQISSIRISVLRDLRTEDQFRPLGAPIVPSLDILRAIVYHYCVELFAELLHLLAPLREQLFQQSAMAFYLAGQIFHGLYLHL